jgi:hypothetical protein
MFVRNDARDPVASFGGTAASKAAALLTNSVFMANMDRT